MDLITERLKLKDVLGDMQSRSPQCVDAIAAEYDDDTPFIRKGLTPSDLQFVEGERAVIATISTLDIDRDHEVVLPEGMDKTHFDLNNVVMFGHNYFDLPLGSAQWVKPNAKRKPTAIIGKTVYASERANPKSEQVYQFQREGFPLAKSIGFIPLDWKTPEDKDWDAVLEGWQERRDAMYEAKGITKAKRNKATPECIYTKWELLEYSDVSVPSNPQATAIAVSKGLITEKQVIPMTKDEVLKPFANEHACRLESPDDFDSFNRVNCDQKSDGKCIDVIYGIKAGKSKIQALRYPKDVWDDDAAESHCKGRGGTFEEASEEDAFSTSTTGGESGRNAPVAISAEGPDSTYKAYAFNDTMQPPDEIWNPALPKSFDIAAFDEADTTIRYSLFTQFLECEVKNIYVNSFDIPSPLIGTYLVAIDAVTEAMTVKDTRRFSYDGKESPPEREYIQLNSTERRRFLVHGSKYCDYDGMQLIKDFSPGWRGIEFSIITSLAHETENDWLMDSIHQSAADNHMLKGEKFALNGQFLEATDDDWDGLVLDRKDVQAIRKSLELTTGSAGRSRGLLFMGPPGTGKTKAGRTIMNDTDSTFIWLSARDMMYGWPDQMLALAFDMAHKLSPTVLFLEDIDGSLDNEYIYVSDLLKTELDGLQKSSGIMTVLTTNHPEKLPLALINRPGRFHHVLHFALPTAVQRKAMLTLWAAAIDAKILDEIVKNTEGFSGAHIRELVDYSAIIAEDEALSIGQALIQSMLRMSDQVDLVSELTNGRKKGIILEDDNDLEITPEMAKLLLELDAQEDGSEVDDEVTPEKSIRYMLGKFV